jgi:hypothetical protein
MEIIIDQLLDYIFNIDNETFYYEFLNVFNDNIILSYDKIKELIYKQYIKSIFVDIDIDILKKKIIDTTIYQFNYILKNLKFNIEMILITLLMNIYSLFRMFKKEFNITKNDYNNSTSVDCKNTKNIKNAIFFAGGGHIRWIIFFLETFNIKDPILNCINETSVNYVELNTDQYTILKSFFNLT